MKVQSGMGNQTAFKAIYIDGGEGWIDLSTMKPISAKMVKRNYIKAEAKDAFFLSTKNMEVQGLFGTFNKDLDNLPTVLTDKEAECFLQATKEKQQVLLGGLIGRCGGKVTSEIKIDKEDNIDLIV